MIKKIAIATFATIVSALPGLANHHFIEWHTSSDEWKTLYECQITINNGRPGACESVAVVERLDYKSVMFAFTVLPKPDGSETGVIFETLKQPKAKPNQKYDYRVVRAWIGVPPEDVPGESPGVCTLKYDEYIKSAIIRQSCTAKVNGYTITASAMYVDERRLKNPDVFEMNGRRISP